MFVNCPTTFTWASSPSIPDTQMSSISIGAKESAV